MESRYGRNRQLWDEGDIFVFLYSSPFEPIRSQLFKVSPGYKPSKGISISDPTIPRKFLSLSEYKPPKATDSTKPAQSEMQRNSMTKIAHFQ